jgi:hypothetical protein
VCVACDVPYSTDGTRVFCIYCKGSKDTAQKEQSVILIADGLSKNFKISSFKAVNVGSIRVERDECPQYLLKHYVILLMQGSCYVSFIEIPNSGNSVRIYWQDTKKL